MSIRLKYNFLLKILGFNILEFLADYYNTLKEYTYNILTKTHIRRPKS